MNNRIFISYRREGGEFLGKMVYDDLKSRGYNVFYDVESLRAGKFNEKIIEVIQGCDDFILLLTTGALDRCTNRDDWVAAELRCALHNGKRIIPLITRNFEFPAGLPADLEAVKNYQGVNITNEYFSAAMDKLVSMLSSSPTATLSSKRVYHDTCKSLFTPAVAVFVMDLIKEKSRTDPYIDLSVCLDCLTHGVDGFTEWVRKESENKNSWVYYRTQSTPSYIIYAQHCEWLLRRYSHESQLALVPFLKAAAALWSNQYDEIAEQVKNIDPQFITGFSCGGMTYRLIDIFSEMNSKYAVCRKDSANQMPEILLFELPENGEPNRIETGSDLYRNIMILYLSQYRLYELFPPCWREGKAFIKQNFPEKTADMMMINQYHDFPRIRAEFASGKPIKLKRDYILTQDYCDASAPMLTRYGREAILDIVNMTIPSLDKELKTCYYLLTCPISPKFRSGTTTPPLRREPHVHSLIVNKLGTYSYPAVLNDKFELSSLASQILDRFALRMAAYDCSALGIFE